MEKTDSAWLQFCSVVVIMFALHAKETSVQKRVENSWFPFEEKYEPFALSVALRTLYCLCAFHRACT